MRPKLKDNVFFAPTDDGIFFRGPSGAMELKGAGLYAWFERLIPYLRGNVELEKLLQSLAPDRRAVVSTLVEKLVGRGFIKDVSKDAPHDLTEAEQARYADVIRFIDDLQDSAGRRFADFRRAKVLVVGRGRPLQAAARGLMQSGLKRLVTLTDDAEAQQRVAPEARNHGESDPDFSWEARLAGVAPAWEQELEPFDIVVAAGVEEWLEELSARCLRGQKRLVAAARLEGAGWVGSVVVPGTPGCWSCARARLRASSEPVQAAWPSMGDMLLGQMAALEVLKSVTAVLPSMVPGNVLHIETRQLQVFQRALPAWPACPVCHKPAEGGLEQQLAAWREARPLEPAEVWSTAERYINPSTGLLAQVAPEALQQIPLYQCEATLRLPGRPTVVAAGRNGDQARLETLRLALETYARLTAERIGDTRGAVLHSGGALADAEARSKPFASGVTLDEWMGRGLLAFAARRVEERLLSGDGVPLAPIDLEKGFVEGWHPLLHRAAVVRYGVPLELYRCAEEGPSSVLVLLQGRRLLGVVAERNLSAAVEKGLMALVHAIQQLPAGGSPSEWASRRPEVTWRTAEPVTAGVQGAPPAWREWTPAALASLEGRGQRVVLRPFTSDAAVARAGLLCGWVWLEESGR
ncbi:hypothetical protein [Vitiosangium sp. GDMCC 1.1324]|uniref:hypothetical protein n=1 Tax=Vitiosangium sp. (strain GDMCC 1.1324) TaxID=2138576 RepID=UPI000D35F1C6|nr:hypothetical protein [Vitiosangium sp. GDMCC 1.1324]PTL78725.1 hypothetical protein DAT35_37285 [Vitiosangium sp. GDMCC 1.1324]